MRCVFWTSHFEKSTANEKGFRVKAIFNVDKGTRLKLPTAFCDLIRLALLAFVNVGCNASSWPIKRLCIGVDSGKITGQNHCCPITEKIQLKTLCFRAFLEAGAGMSFLNSLSPLGRSVLVSRRLSHRFYIKPGK